MRCSVCQSINEDDANFCRTCGATIAHPPQPTGPLPPPAPPRHSPDPLWAQTVPSTSPDQQWADSVQASAPYPDAYPDAHPDADVAPTLAVPIEPGMATDVRRTVAAELAVRRRRNRALLIAGAVVVAVLCGVVAVSALGDDSESPGSTGSADPATDSALPVVTTVAPIGATTVVGATIPPTATVTTQAAPTTIAVVVASPPSTAAPTVTSAPAAATTAATTAPTVAPATVAPTVAPTTAAPTPVTTAVPTTTTPAPPAGTGDLGLSIPISKPACDGQYITLIGASVDTPGIAGRVNGLLNQYPGSNYLKAELVCSSLSPRSADGKALYIVFFGPFASTADACSARSKGTKDSYVKVLENTPEPSGAEKC